MGVGAARGCTSLEDSKIFSFSHLSTWGVFFLAKNEQLAVAAALSIFSYIRFMHLSGMN